MPLYSVRLPIGWTCLKKKKGIKVQRRPFKKTVPLPSTTWWLTNLFVKNLNFRWGRFLFKQRPYQHVAVGFAPSRPGCLWHCGHLDRVSIWLPPLLTPYRCFYRVLERIFFFYWDFGLLVHNKEHFWLGLSTQIQSSSLYILLVIDDLAGKLRSMIWARLGPRGENK